MNICDAYSDRCDLVGVAGIGMRERTKVVLDHLCSEALALGEQYKDVLLSDERAASH